MRVTCLKVSEFKDNLRTAGVYLNRVYVSIARRPIDDTPAQSAVKFGVVVHCSAVVNVNETEQFLLECAEDCGIDYEDAEGDLEGTRKANMLKNDVQSFCEERGWSVFPGVLGF